MKLKSLPFSFLKLYNLTMSCDPSCPTEHLLFMTFATKVNNAHLFSLGADANLFML